jgi:NAD-dependent deacetylase
VPAYNRIVILTGAGISAESGIPTFRDANGLWENHDIESVASREAFERDPAFVHRFYNMRRAALMGVGPNTAHSALARLQREHAGRVTLVTQNIDPLHELAGSTSVLHMHGELLKVWCMACNARHVWPDELLVDTACPSCTVAGRVRPDVVWFGEMPYQMERIALALNKADLFISIGTSGNVYPAAGFVALATQVGAHTVELNLEPSVGSSQFAEAIHGPATKVVQAFVERLLMDQ